MSTVALTALAVVLKSVDICLRQKKTRRVITMSNDNDRLGVKVKHNKYADPP